MHHFPRRDSNEDKEAIERFERRSSDSNESYFDVHQIEYIFEYYIEKGDYDKALDAIEFGLSQHPMATTLMLRKATLLMDAARMDEAKTILLLLSKIETNDPDVFVHLGSLYLFEGNLDDGLTCLKKAHFLGSEHGEELIDIIVDICNQLNFYNYYFETIEYINTLDSQYRTNRQVEFEFAVANENLLQFDIAIESYQKLLNQDPFLENVWYNLANVFNKEGKYDDAIDAYLYTLAINPYHLDATFNLGNCYIQKEMLDEALDCYLEHVSHQLFPDPVYPYIADCYERMVNYDYAYKYYKLILEKNPDSLEGLIGTGNCYFEFEKFRLALKAYKKALEIVPENGAAWFSIGKCHFALKQIKSAVKSFRVAVELDEFDTAAWFELYFLRHEIGEKEAQKLFSKLEQYDNENGSLYYLCVVIWMEQKNPTNALEVLKKAVALNPLDLEILLEYYPEIYNEPLLADYINLLQNDEL